MGFFEETAGKVRLGVNLQSRFKGDYQIGKPKSNTDLFKFSINNFRLLAELLKDWQSAAMGDSNDFWKFDGKDSRLQFMNHSLDGQESIRVYQVLANLEKCPLTELDGLMEGNRYQAFVSAVIQPYREIGWQLRRLLGDKGLVHTSQLPIYAQIINYVDSLHKSTKTAIIDKQPDKLQVVTWWKDVYTFFVSRLDCIFINGYTLTAKQIAVLTKPKSNEEANPKGKLRKSRLVVAIEDGNAYQDYVKSFPNWRPLGFCHPEAKASVVDKIADLTACLRALDLNPDHNASYQFLIEFGYQIAFFNAKGNMQEHIHEEAQKTALGRNPEKAMQAVRDFIHLLVGVEEPKAPSETKRMIPGILESLKRLDEWLHRGQEREREREREQKQKVDSSRHFKQMQGERKWSKRELGRQYGGPQKMIVTDRLMPANHDNVLNHAQGYSHPF